MRGTTTTTEPAVRAYARLLRQLHALIAKGADESPEGEAIREEMDILWQAMSQTECDRMNGLSEDLHSLIEGNDRRVRMDPNMRAEWEDDLQNSMAQENYDRTLELLRRPPIDVTIPRIRELTRTCWEKLSDIETARVFLPPDV